MFQQGGPQHKFLEQMAGHDQVLLHSLHLDIGGLDPIDPKYLAEIKRIMKLSQARIYTDHLAFSQLDNRQSFDLLPIPLNKEHLEHVVQRVHLVQDVLGFQIGLENISSYVRFPEDQIPELEFLQTLADRTGCGILLDVNNLYVNAHNFGFDPLKALDSLRASSIIQYHCSGHRQRGLLLHDTHDQMVIEPVWQLLQRAIELFGWHPVILERDDDDVTLAVIMNELCHGLGQIG